MDFFSNKKMKYWFRNCLYLKSTEKLLYCNVELLKSLQPPPPLNPPKKQCTIPRTVWNINQLPKTSQLILKDLHLIVNQVPVVLDNYVSSNLDSLIDGGVVQLILTVSWHSHSKTFFKSAVLTSVATESYYHTLSVPQTSVFDLLLNTTTKKSLKRRCQ